MAQGTSMLTFFGKEYDRVHIHFQLPDGYNLELRYVYDDNYYTYARLEMPNGDIWNGWSGYGVGAGLEDAGYGYSTERCEQRLYSIWPHDFMGVEG